MDHKQFYSELGKLLYAIADIDGMITKEEKQKMLELVKRKLVPPEKEKDQFGTNKAWYAEMEFDYLDEQIVEPVAAFESFVDFVEDHYSGFTEQMLKLSVDLSKEIARAYRGTNKKEEQVIHELVKKLKAIKKHKAYSPKLKTRESPDI